MNRKRSAALLAVMGGAALTIGAGEAAAPRGGGMTSSMRPVAAASVAAADAATAVVGTAGAPSRLDTPAAVHSATMATSTVPVSSPSAAPKSTGGSSVHGTCTVWTESASDDDALLQVKEPGLWNTWMDVGPQAPPQLDLLSGTMAVSGTTLVVGVHVVDMEEQVPTGSQGMEWDATWNYNGVGYEAYADYSAISGLRFGVVSSVAGSNVGGSAVDTPVSGRVTTGPGGGVEIDVPLSLAGNPPTGAVLLSPAAETRRATVDTATPVLIGSNMVVDSGGPEHDYAVGVGCG